MDVAELHGFAKRIERGRPHPSRRPHTIKREKYRWCGSPRSAMVCVAVYKRGADEVVRWLTA